MWERLTDDAGNVGAVVVKQDPYHSRLRRAIVVETGLPISVSTHTTCRPRLPSVCHSNHCHPRFRAQDDRFIALLSVYDKTGLLPFAKGLKELGFRLLGSGGTAKQIREAGMEIE